jgi:hypothetical protein
LRVRGPKSGPRTLFDKIPMIDYTARSPSDNPAMISEARRARVRRVASRRLPCGWHRSPRSRGAREPKSERTQRHPWDPSRVRASRTNPSAHYSMGYWIQPSHMTSLNIAAQRPIQTNPRPSQANDVNDVRLLLRCRSIRRQAAQVAPALQTERTQERAQLQSLSSFEYAGPKVALAIERGPVRILETVTPGAADPRTHASGGRSRGTREGPGRQPGEPAARDARAAGRSRAT